MFLLYNTNPQNIIIYCDIKDITFILFYFMMGTTVFGYNTIWIGRFTFVDPTILLYPREKNNNEENKIDRELNYDF